MTVKQIQYEVCLAEYSNDSGAIALLKQHRPYLEMMPSLRRAQESIINIPLPVVRLRYRDDSSKFATATQLPCDLVILMCDPDWKIKTGVEIVVVIHRPQEDFSDLLKRWRQTQVLLDGDYEWLMPAGYQHLLNDGTNKIYPLFVTFDETPERIKRGLQGANLPFITEALNLDMEQIEVSSPPI